MPIRQAIKEDLASMVAIHNQAISRGLLTGHTEPLTVESQTSWFASHQSERYPLFVEEEAGTVRGWCSLSPYRSGRGAMSITAEITYYVDFNYHRQGIGRRLVDYAIEASTRLGFKNLLAIVLETNVASVGLLKIFGFTVWARLPDIAEFDGNEVSHIYLGKRIF